MRDCPRNPRVSLRTNPRASLRVRQPRLRGSATTETLVALLALTPFLAGIPLLGKQLDIKHKTYDAARYAVWERTVWRSDGASNRKGEQDIALETRDRALGDPHSGILAVSVLRSEGITENALWRDRTNKRLLDYEHDRAAMSIDIDERGAPVDVGYRFVPALAYGDGYIAAAANVLQVDDLDLNRRAFATASLEIGVRPVLAQMAEASRTLGTRDMPEPTSQRLLYRAGGAVLSETWSAGSENDFRRRVDDVTTNELLEMLEAPARPIGMQALGKGRPLYGEGQFAWDPDLQPSSSTLPAAYIAPE